MADDIDTDRVLAWMKAEERMAPDAVDHFWPGLTADERRRAIERVRKAAQRARLRGSPLAPPKLLGAHDHIAVATAREAHDAALLAAARGLEPEPPPDPPRGVSPARRRSSSRPPPPPAAVAPGAAYYPDLGPPPPAPDPDGTRAEFLRAQLVYALYDIAVARIRNDQRTAAQIDARISAIRREYDEVMEMERRVVKLDRTAGAICAELDKYHEVIALRAEMFRRKLLKPPVAAEATNAK